jgi:hypothetical protein
MAMKVGIDFEMKFPRTQEGQQVFVANIFGPLSLRLNLLGCPFLVGVAVE